MADRIIPNYRIKRILEIDEHMPRMNKKALSTLSKSLKIFLQEYAKDIHKHIVNTGSSYPVKPQHIVNVSLDPRFIKYEFLTHASKIIETHEHEAESINKLMKLENKNKINGADNGSNRNNVYDSINDMNKNKYIGNDGCKLSIVDNSKSVISSSFKRSIKTSSKNADKRQKNSILSYFGSK